MKRIFERKIDAAGDTEANVTEKIKVGVTGIGTGAGASFVSVSLAYFAAQYGERKSAFVQLDGRYGDILHGNSTNTVHDMRNTEVYDALGMDKRFFGREFTDFF